MSHDGVRPLISEEVIEENIESVEKYGTAVTCTPFFETPGQSVCREKWWKICRCVNTCLPHRAPQSFRLGEIVRAHEEVRKTNPGYKDIADSCYLYGV